MLKTLEEMIKTANDNQHMIARAKMESITSKAEFQQLLDDNLFTDDERHLLTEHYAHGKSLSYIADTMGYSESTIKRIHKQALTKVYASM